MQHTQYRTGYRLNLTAVGATPRARTDMVASIPLGFYTERRRIYGYGAGAAVFALIGLQVASFAGMLVGIALGAGLVHLFAFWEPNGEPFSKTVWAGLTGDTGRLRVNKDISGKNTQYVVVPLGQPPPKNGRKELENQHDSVWSVQSTLPVKGSTPGVLTIGTHHQSRRRAIGSSWGSTTVPGIVPL